MDGVLLPAWEADGRCVLLNRPPVKQKRHLERVCRSILKE